MKTILLLIFCSLSIAAFSQHKKPFSIGLSGNFDFHTRGLATNDAGLGIGLNASYAIKQKLQLLIEINRDWFIGDKLLVVDSQLGSDTKPAAINTIKAGGRFFITKKLGVSAMAGPAWHTIREFTYAQDMGYQFGFDWFHGSKERVLTRLFLAGIPNNQVNIHYWGIQLGYRIY